MLFVWSVDWGDRWPPHKMTHTHIEEKEIPRSVSELIETAKRGELSTKEQIEIGCALELWQEMALRCERTIHRLTKGEPLP